MQHISICRTVKKKDYPYSDQAARYSICLWKIGLRRGGLAGKRTGAATTTEKRKRSTMPEAIATGLREEKRKKNGKIGDFSVQLD